MEFLVGLIVAGVVAFLVVQDAAALRDEEVRILGSSNISPGLWGTGVFLFMIIFLPAYLFVRSSHKRQLTMRCPSCGSPVTYPGMCSSCRGVAQPETASAPPIADSMLDEIAKAHALLKEGAITQAEFESIKGRHLA